MNTILSDDVPEGVFAASANMPKVLRADGIAYNVPPADMPPIFDPRFKDKVPESVVSDWFYQDFKGNWIPVISEALDQAGCGSCWEFFLESVWRCRASQSFKTIQGQGVRQFAIFPPADRLYRRESVNLPRNRSDRRKCQYLCFGATQFGLHLHGRFSFSPQK